MWDDRKHLGLGAAGQVPLARREISQQLAQALILLNMCSEGRRVAVYDNPGITYPVERDLNLVICHVALQRDLIALTLVCLLAALQLPGIEEKMAEGPAGLRKCLWGGGVGGFRGTPFLPPLHSAPHLKALQLAGGMEEVDEAGWWPGADSAPPPAVGPEVTSTDCLSAPLKVICRCAAEETNSNMHISSGEIP
ncbi:hypothetical protein NQZ68_005751 [Dissostichus eleginoides]|nr:hypothetical protein NQZ68_005751 [Dissostichus eleginoides]